MDSHYPPAIPPLSTVFVPQPVQFSSAPSPSRLQQVRTMSMDSRSDHDDSPLKIQAPSHGQRQRRRLPQGADHIKHRRTRSGCFTCRQRRVKCDETHPTCERCRKGKRECAYPGTAPMSAGSSSGRSRSKNDESPSGSSVSVDDYDDDNQPLCAIPDDDEEAASGESPVLSMAASARKRSATSVPSSATSASARNSSSQPLKPPLSRASDSKHSVRHTLSDSSRWTDLPKDVRGYLRYHMEHLSYHHYGFRYDSGDFLKSTFLDIALHDDSQALLYGIVAFASYHFSIAHNGSHALGFLKYYNQSILMLGQSLSRKRPSVATLLTILQLATIEEFLGDWPTLVGHRRAAHQILTDLFTPETIMQGATRRRILSWYSRFDILTGSMAGDLLHLGREWYAAQSEFSSCQARDRPDDMEARINSYIATSRLLHTDGISVVAARKRNVINDEEFAARTARLAEEYSKFSQVLNLVSADPSNFFKSWPRSSPEETSITDVGDPKFLFKAESFAKNYVLADWWTFDLYFKQQVASVQRQPPTPEMVGLAVRACKIIDAIFENCDQGPPGAILGCQSSLRVAALFLPKEKRYTDWARRKFALIEQHGYIYPMTLRTHMSNLWNEDMTHWWLPNDLGYPASVRTVREFVASRTADSDGAWTMAASKPRNMKNIFGPLDVAGTMFDDLQFASADSDVLDLQLD